MKYRPTLSGVMILPVVAALLVWGYDRGIKTCWVGGTDLEIEFRIMEAECHAPIAGARVEIESEGGFYAERDQKQLTLIADGTGIASSVCHNSMCFGTRSQLGFTDTFSMHLPWWRFKVVAPGYESDEWEYLDSPARRRQVQRPSGGRARLVVEVAMNQAAAPADRIAPWPEKDGSVSIAAQEWPLKPGGRQIAVSIHYPGGQLKNVNATTGIMLTLHNWGGTGCVGTADPKALAQRYNVIALCVDYLQSGKPGVDGPEPYDFATCRRSTRCVPALRFRWFAAAQIALPRALYDRRSAVARHPHGEQAGTTDLRCVIDLCGMPRLSNDVAFNLPGGSDLDARYSRDPKSPNFLSPDAQQLRDLGHAEHLQVMKRLKTACQIVVVHGTEDTTCPFADAKSMVESMKKAGLEVTPHFIGRADLDGKVFTSAGHSLGNRTQIVFRVADKFLLLDSADARVRKGPTDFERRDAEVRYQTPGGAFVISYKDGFPVGRFEAK